MQIYDSQCFRGESRGRGDSCQGGVSSALKVSKGLTSVSCLSSVLKVSKGLTLGLLIFFSFPAIASASLTSGLVGYWTFNGKDTNWGTNKTNDLSGQGNTGTLTNMSTTTSPVVGKIGQGLNFDGSDDVVNVPHAASITPTSAVTVSAWINPRTAGENGRGRIVDKIGAGSTGYALLTDDGSSLCSGGTNAITFSLNNTNVGCSGNNTISYNIWQHA